MNALQIMPLILEHTVQSPRDPQDQQGKQHGYCIQGHIQHRGGRRHAPHQGHRRPAQLHQKQHRGAKNQRFAHAFPYFLRPQRPDQPQGGQAKQIAHAKNHIILARRAGHPTQGPIAVHRAAQHRVKRGPRAPAHHHHGRDSRHRRHGISLVGKPSQGSRGDQGFKKNQHHRKQE